MPPEPDSSRSLLTDTERNIVKTVVDRFLNLNDMTPQRELEVRFKDPDAISRLFRYGLITLPSDQKYSATILGIALRVISLL